MSAGECQLISITRALLSDRKIILMDEATSNIDMHSDEMIQAAMKEQFSNRTVLTVAHRLNTVLGSDKILVM